MALDVRVSHPLRSFRLELELSVEPGVLALVGPSGAGKTSVLRAVAGLLAPEGGWIALDGEPWLDTARNVDVPPEARRVGFVFQEYALFPHLTAAGNVIAALGHRPRGERRHRAEALLSVVHLAGKATRRPHELSGGERQRVALARALAREPAVLLLDEPFAAVDRQVRRSLQNEIDALRRTLDMPLVLVTHDFDDVVRVATSVLILERGKGVACDAVPALTSRPDLGWLRESVGLGSVIEATVGTVHPDRGLVELDFDGGRLLVADRGVPKGAIVRVRIPAREVILATREPEGLSLHNVLSGTVSSIHTDPADEHVVVQIDLDRARLLAEVTRDALVRLQVEIGTRVYALVKSVSIDVWTSGASGSTSGPERTAHPD